MKKYLCLLLLPLFLTGCAAEPTFETVSDDLVQSVIAQPRQVSVHLPDDAVAPVLQSDMEQVWFSEEYLLAMETLSSGDLEATVEHLSGYASDQLTLIRTDQPGYARYDFVWAATGEDGEHLGRGAILDDGTYHYCLSVIRDAQPKKPSQIVWDQVFSSFALL